MAPEETKLDTAAGRPTAERIQKRAYEVFESRRGVDGDAVSDWLQAERELTGGAGQVPASGRSTGPTSRSERK